MCIYFIQRWNGIEHRRLKHQSELQALLQTLLRQHMERQAKRNIMIVFALLLKCSVLIINWNPLFILILIEESFKAESIVS